MRPICFFSHYCLSKGQSFTNSDCLSGLVIVSGARAEVHSNRCLQEPETDAGHKEQRNKRAETEVVQVRFFQTYFSSFCVDAAMFCITYQFICRSF